MSSFSDFPEKSTPLKVFVWSIRAALIEFKSNEAISQVETQLILQINIKNTKTITCTNGYFLIARTNKHQTNNDIDTSAFILENCMTLTRSKEIYNIF